MKSETLIETMLELFPHLREKYQEEGEYIMDNTHLTFSFVFYVYAIDVFLQTGNEDEKRKIADFINKMVDSRDISVQEVAVATVLFNFSTDGYSRLIRPYLSKEAKTSLDAQPGIK